jgi:peptidoglycan/xylan/chitin deacetylase (PgdA/CDA1 family)
MEWLYSNGYSAISLSRLKDSQLPEKAVVITFDDGYASFMDFSFPLLQSYRFKATINIIGNAVGSYLPMAGNRPMLSWDEYRYLTAGGIVDLGCHTFKLHAFRHRGVLDVPEKNALQRSQAVPGNHEAGNRQTFRDHCLAIRLLLPAQWRSPHRRDSTACLRHGGAFSVRQAP